MSGSQKLFGNFPPHLIRYWLNWVIGGIAGTGMPLPNDRLWTGMLQVVKMTNHHVKKRVKKPRIELTGQDLQHFSDTILTQSVPALVKRTGLSYMLIYNIVHIAKQIGDDTPRVACYADKSKTASTTLA